MNILKYLYSYLKPISPTDCLVKKIHISKLADALANEDKEFFKKRGSKPKQYYEQMIASGAWKKFLSMLEPEDDLWFFRFPDSYWKKLKGRQGYVILRKGKIVDKVITFMN